MVPVWEEVLTFTLGWGFLDSKSRFVGLFNVLSVFQFIKKFSKTFTTFKIDMKMCIRPDHSLEVAILFNYVYCKFIASVKPFQTTVWKQIKFNQPISFLYI